ncbi:MAG: hypothetical protein AAF941_03440 [Pseudomonadota bacterium]
MPISDAAFIGLVFGATTLIMRFRQTGRRNVLFHIAVTWGISAIPFVTTMLFG